MTITKRTLILHVGLLGLLALGCRERRDGTLEPEIAPRLEPAAERAAEGARDLARGARDLAGRVGEAAVRTGREIKAETADERRAFAEKTREALADVERWIDDEAAPAAKRGARATSAELRESIAALRRRLDRLGDEVGPKAEQERREIGRELEQLRARANRPEPVGTVPP